jgi:hypothetical protein
VTGSGTGLGVGGITGTPLSIASLSSKPKPPPGPPIDIKSSRLGGKGIVCSGCDGWFIVGGTNGIDSPTGKGLTKFGSCEGRLGINGNGTGPDTFGESLGISKLGIGSAIGGTDGDNTEGKIFLGISLSTIVLGGNPIGRLGILGNLIAGPRGRDGVNFGGMETFGSMPIVPNLALKLLNKPIINSV